MAELTAAQQAAIAKADAQIAPAMALYAERNRIMHLACRLPLRDLQRLNRVLERLTDDDLRAVAAYAEGLADWNAPP